MKHSHDWSSAETPAGKMIEKNGVCLDHVYLEGRRGSLSSLALSLRQLRR